MELEPQEPNANDPRKVIKERHEVDPKTGCWEWTGYVKESTGYGELSVNGENHGAHRVSYAIHNGDIPDGEWVLHKCHNPSCINPDHLYTGDVRDNVQDAMEEGSFWHDGQLQEGEDNMQSKLTEQDVRKIKRMIRDPEPTYDDIVDEFDISKPNITAIKNGRTWRHVEIE